MIKLSIWTPLPHTIPSEPQMEHAIADLLSGADDASEEVIYVAQIGMFFQNNQIAQ